MEQQIPTALQAALYAGSVAIIALVAVLTVLLLQFRSQMERVVRAVEELKAEVSPLVQETRDVVERLRDLSWRVHGRWMEVEGIIDTARIWSQRASHLADGIGSLMEPPILVASRNIQILRKGLETFVRAFLNRKQEHQQKARES
jgi:uncharacterized protein DUF948